MLGEEAEGTRRDVMSRWLELLRPRGPVDQLLQAIGDAVIVADPDMRIVYSNDRGAQLCGYATREAMIESAPGEVAERFDMFDENGAPFPFEDIPGIVALRTGRPAERVIRFRHRDTGQSG